MKKFRAKAPPKPVAKTVLDEYRESGDWQGYMETFIKIKSKGQGIIPWEFNKAQQRVYDYLCEHNFQNCKLFILKVRQETGMTTFTMNFGLTYAQMRPGRNVKSFLPDWKKSFEKWEDIVRVSYDAIPVDAKLKNMTNTTNTMAFTNRSRFQVEPPVGEAGRSGTVDVMLCSEVAYYEGFYAWLAAIKPSLAREGVIIYETTANGYNHAREIYYAAKEKIEGFEDWDVMFFPATDFFDMNNPEDVAFLKSEKAALKERFPQEYPNDDVTCFITSGGAYLDGNALKLYMDRIESGMYEIERFDFKRETDCVRVVPNDYGELHVYKQPKPGHLYIMGGDCAEGKPDGDFNVGVMIDRLTDEVVAFYKTQDSETTYADNVNSLGRWYNNAILVIENNNPGGAVNNRLIRDYEYPEIYYDYQIEKVKQGAAPEPGIRTTTKTKEIHYGELQLWIRDMLLIIPFPEMIAEMFSLVKKNGTIKGESGCHDDIPTATSKAVYVHRNSPYIPPVDKDLPKPGTIAEFKYLQKRKRRSDWVA